MNGSSRALVAIAALAMLPCGHLARAQEEVPADAPAPPAADASVETGFTPDPVRLTGTTRGARPLNAIAPGCRGYVGDGPDKVVELRTAFGFLRFFVTASSDVTLALRGPDGRWRCSGRPLAGAPREEGSYVAGRYEVWIGGAQPGAQVAYELNVTEFRSVTPGSRRTSEARSVSAAEIGLDVRAETGRHRDRRMRRGFLPDPRVDPGVAGGPIDVALLGGGCRGHVEARPSHVLTLRDDFDYFRVTVRDASAPVTLVIRAPSGEYFCSAPDEGAPVVERDAWPAGRYPIWVGSREAGATPRYSIEYTETRPAEP